MALELIADRDRLFRHSVFPISFSNAKKFVPEKFIKLYIESDGSLLASVAWEKYLPTTFHVHAYGCRLAHHMNKKQGEAIQAKGAKRKIYCGSYQLAASDVRKLKTAHGLDEIKSADVTHHIENSEIAHTELRILFRSEKDFDIEGSKTAIIDRLWNACSGPLRHVCDCDRDVARHPSLELPVGPRGEYVDSRSKLCRLWFLVRFHVMHWLWRKSLKNGGWPTG